MPLAPCSTHAIDFADSSSFLKSSADARGGLGAPFWMATAIPERARGVREASLPSLLRASVPASVRTATSKAAPFSIWSLSCAAVPQVKTSLWPELCSNFGPRSSSTDFTALLERTLISAAAAGAPSAKAVAATRKQRRPIMQSSRLFCCSTANALLCRVAWQEAIEPANDPQPVTAPWGALKRRGKEAPALTSRGELPAGMACDPMRRATRRIEIRVQGILRVVAVAPPILSERVSLGRAQLLASTGALSRGNGRSSRQGVRSGDPHRGTARWHPHGGVGIS